MMEITIITISYNNKLGLKKTVDSVLSQTAREKIQYIVIDGDSVDGSKEYLESMSSRIDCWVSEKDNGISDAFNKGLKFARGKLILMLNSGDVFCSKNVIEKVILEYEKLMPDILSYKVVVDKNHYIPSTDSEIQIWEDCELPHQGTFVSKTVYDLVGCYSEEYSLRMDYHFFSRCKNRGFKFVYVPEVIVKYEPGGASMKKENRMKFWKEGISVKMLYGLKICFKDIVKMIKYNF